MVRAVAYARYSTDNQTENSIIYQLNAIQDYCTKNSLDLVDIYADEAKTGTNTDRAALQRLLGDCDSGNFGAVVIYDQSRLSRSVMDWFSLRETLSHKNIRLYSCNETISDDILDSSSFLSEGVHAIFNHVHVLETRKKSIAGTTAKAKRAEFCGGTPPLGYDVVNGQYVINEREAEAIRLIFGMYADGYSYKEIMVKLTELGVKSKRDNVIGENAIYYLLKNDRYLGIYTWNRWQTKQMRKRIAKRDNPNFVKIENALPAIINQDIWRKVEKRMLDNKNKARNKAKREYLLSGLLECGYCGGAFQGFASKNRSSGEETYYYTCGTKKQLHTCTAKNIRADEIESAVYYILRDEILNKGLIERTADAIINIRSVQPDNSEEIKKEISQRQGAVKNLLSALERGLNTDVGLGRIDELQLEIKTLQARLAACSPAGVINRAGLIEQLTLDAEKLNGDFHAKRAVFREYINKVLITDDCIEVQCIGDLSTTGGATRI